MIIIVGSYAMRRYCDINRIPSDLDIIGTYEEVEAFIKATLPTIKSFVPTTGGKKIVASSLCGFIIEAEIAWPNSLAEELMNIVTADIKSNEVFHSTFTHSIQYEGSVMLPSVDILLMLKLSHRFLRNSPAFNKTMNDIHQLQSRCAAIIRPEHHDWYKRRELATYNYAHPALNVSKDNFFGGSGLTYVYDHDSIHEAVKHLDRPAYTFFKPIDEEVLCCREMFELLPESVRLLAVLEETYVLAIERSQVPFPNTPLEKSFNIALEKVCTSITSGWFRDYAWSNYDKVKALYDPNFIKKFRDGIEQNIVTNSG